MPPIPLASFKVTPNNVGRVVEQALTRNGLTSALNKKNAIATFLFQNRKNYSNVRVGQVSIEAKFHEKNKNNLIVNYGSNVTNNE